MAWRLEFTPRAAKALRKLPPETGADLLKALRALLQALDGGQPFPGPPKVKSLVGQNLRRLRVGDWRVIFSVGTDADGPTLLVQSLGHRREVYR